MGKGLHTPAGVIGEAITVQEIVDGAVGDIGIVGLPGRAQKDRQKHDEQNSHPHKCEQAVGAVGYWQQAQLHGLFQAVEVGGDGALQAKVQGIANQGMADGHLFHPRNVLVEIGQIFEA